MSMHLGVNGKTLGHPNLWLERMKAARFAGKPEDIETRAPLDHEVCFSGG